MPYIAIDEPTPFALHTPTTLDAALELAAQYHGDYAYLAGGCDLIDMLKRQWNTSGHVINLKQIRSLAGISQHADSVLIGATTKLTDIENADLGQGLQALTQSAARVATPQIRNVGTIGGNLLQDSRCPYYRGPWYCYRHGGIVCDAHHGINREHAIFGAARCYTVTPSDLAPVAVAMDAVIHVTGNHGPATLPARKLFVSPSQDITIMHRLQHGEILSVIEFPVPDNQRSAFVKNTTRNAWDFARASAAVVCQFQQGTVHNARIVLGGVAAIPWRSRAAEQQLEGATLSDKTIENAASAATEGASPLQYNGYKVGLVKSVVRQALTQIGNS